MCCSLLSQSIMWLQLEFHQNHPLLYRMNFTLPFTCCESLVLLNVHSTSSTEFSLVKDSNVVYESCYGYYNKSWIVTTLICKCNERCIIILCFTLYYIEWYKSCSRVKLKVGSLLFLCSHLLLCSHRLLYSKSLSSSWIVADTRLLLILIINRLWDNILLKAFLLIFEQLKAYYESQEKNIYESLFLQNNRT